VNISNFVRNVKSNKKNADFVIYFEKILDFYTVLTRGQNV